jgi:hypothetical protein
MTREHSPLPEPVPLRQAAIITYQWGETQFEILCTACSFRTYAWEETGEVVTWLHCKAMRTAEINPDGPTSLMQVLISAHYVTGIKPGPPFQVARRNRAQRLGMFPPNQPTPPDALPLEQVEEAVADLMSPDRN